jgi:nitrogen regulatory protein PII
MAGIVLEQEPADNIIFFVPETSADSVIQTLSTECSLTIPGRGSVVSEEAGIVEGSVWEDSQPLGLTEKITAPIRYDLSCITCTIVKGRGDSIAKAVLGLGLPMPQVTVGTGTGLRDKLGLIRIALPADKEVVHAVVSRNEANDILDSLVSAGNLDRFGVGFIFASSNAKGIINSMVIRGQRHSASIEQIIAAVDDIKGTTDWRKRSFGDNNRASKTRNYLYDLVNLTLICNEGRAIDMVRAAMTVGGSGATISKLNYARSDKAKSSLSPAREMSELIVGSNVVDAIVNAMVSEGVFDSETAGSIILKSVKTACTYRGAKR